MSKQNSFLTLSLCALSFLSSLGFASEESMNKALDAWQKENKEYEAAIKYAQTEEQREALLQKGPQLDTLAEALWKSISTRVGYREVETKDRDIADRFSKPKITKVPIYGFEQSWSSPAVCWLLNHPIELEKALAGADVSKIIKSLLKSIIDTHYDQPSIADVCAPLSGVNNIQAYECLEKIYMRNPNDKARACAAMGMSILLMDEQIRNHEGSEEMSKAKRVYYIKAALSIAPEQCMFGDLSIDEVAIEQLYRINKLGEDCIPPAISVATVDNKVLSLPLRDQAQLIFFWSPQHGESIQLIKRFKELSERYPLIKIIAVAPPTTRDELKEIYEFEAIDYPTFIDKDNKAAQSYRVTQAPYVAFIDEKGKLLYLGTPDIKLQAKLTGYIEELKSKQNDAEQLQQVKEINKMQTSPQQEQESSIPALREIPEL